MNTTLIVFILVILVYLGISAYQWHRLRRADKEDHEHPQLPGPSR